MTTHVALLRAVNVGGTGNLPMPRLRSLCEAAGFLDVRTYIASGNVAFLSAATEGIVKRRLETALAAHVGQPVGVLVRTSDEMAAVHAANPFPDGAPNATVAIFLDDAPDPGALDQVRGRQAERIALGQREIYVDYGEGMGRSKLVVPAARAGTARNMNTIAKLRDLAGAPRANGK